MRYGESGQEVTDVIRSSDAPALHGKPVCRTVRSVVLPTICPGRRWGERVLVVDQEPAVLGDGDGADGQVGPVDGAFGDLQVYLAAADRPQSVGELDLRDPDGRAGVADGEPVGGLEELGLSSKSNAWLVSGAQELAVNMQKVADAAKSEHGIDARFSNPVPDFEGKVIGSPESVHGLVLHAVDSDNPIKDWPILKDFGLSAQSFHPKISGARL
ncbi:hypothetical protein [Streptomyces sp. NPDC018045]|uniref:hypothetical protein n=1 Tax=Streptomyces sp. NPDC018045 TaxID=3365037 RepID=UPI0037A97075